MSARFEVGELVDVAIRNARVVEADATSVMVEAKDMDAMWLDLSAVTVTRVAPKEWPPQPGDVWLDVRDTEWFGHGEGETAGLLSANGLIGGAADGALSNYGPLRLAYRRGWSPKPGPPAAEPAALDERAEQIAGLRELADWLDANPAVPIGSYIGSMQVHVTNLPHMWNTKDDETLLAELARIADLMGVAADLRDGPNLPHPRAVKKFRGGVEFEVVHVTEAYKRGYKDLPVAGEEVAGVAVGSAPATAAQSEHYHSGGAAGGLGENEAECACGAVFAGFDTHAEATAALDRHIADAEDSPAGPTASVDDPPGEAVHEDSRPQDRPGPADVWVARRRRGIAYHGFHGLGTVGQFTACGRAARSNGHLITRAEAEEFGAVPCDRCYAEPEG